MQSPSKHAEPAEAARGELVEEAIDEAQLMENMAGCREILVEAGQVFLQDVGSMLASLRAAVVARDVRATERATHLIKGALLSLAATPAARMATSLERRARAGECASPDSVQAFVDQVSRVREALVRIMSAR
jgi:HPt (histidine-containing phosphotransfer) domain-containing protein